jgi:hypothetical protein
MMKNLGENVCRIGKKAGSGVYLKCKTMFAQAKAASESK